ncbi:MAG: N-acetylmuramoyl-L-alanine amidase [Ruminococcus sp.]|nr:N-acetylmuramoyl-L-alanine amidase [Ruminococcus sp.]
MANKRKVKIYWGRIFTALAVLIAFIILLVMAIRGIIGVFTKSDDKEATEANASSVADTDDGTLDVTIFLNPGHGGEEDSGALSVDETRYEKDDNLTVGLLVRDELESRGITVIMSREDDTFVSLSDTAEMANESGADLFVSLHRNSADIGYGVEAWVNWNAPKADTLLADNILSALNESTISENRGVGFGYIGYSYTAHVNYAVNNQTTMPSCLLELLFITDEDDNVLFDEYVEEYAVKIADGIEKTVYQLGIAEDPDGEITEIDLDSYSYPGAPETVEVTDPVTGDGDDSSSSNDYDFIDTDALLAKKWWEF